MTIRADRDPRYYTRFWLIGLGAIAFALYCVYDGAIAYPNQRERALAYQELEKDKRLSEWPKMARERGWKASNPGKPKEEEEITMQYIMAGVSAAVALVILFGVWRSRGRWMEASDKGLTSSWGQNLDFDQVLSVDKRIWKSKGIAKVKYQDGKGRRKFVLDNYKFDQHKTTAILRALEAHVGAEKIVNGVAEPPLESLDENPAEPVANQA